MWLHLPCVAATFCWAQGSLHRVYSVRIVFVCVLQYGDEASSDMHLFW